MSPKSVFSAFFYGFGNKNNFLKIEKTLSRQNNIFFCNTIILRVSWPILVLPNPIASKRAGLVSKTPLGFFWSLPHIVLAPWEIAHNIIVINAIERRCSSCLLSQHDILSTSNNGFSKLVCKILNKLAGRLGMIMNSPRGDFYPNCLPVVSRNRRTSDRRRG